MSRVRRCKRTCLAAAGFLALSLVATVVHAEKVVLVRPADEQALLTELFNRLQGEFRMQGIEAQLASPQAPLDSTGMRQLAEAANANACVALEWKDEQPAIMLWLVNGQTGQPELLTLGGSDEADSAEVLPLRTLELLRSAKSTDRQPPAVAPSSKPSSTLETKAAPKPAARRARRLFFARSYAVVEWPTVVHGPTLGAGFSGAVLISPRFSLGAAVLLPFSASSVDSTHATARYRMTHLATVASYRFWLGRGHWWLEPSLGLGATYVYATADVDESLVALQASGWSSSAAAGLGLWFAVNERFSVGVASRIGALLPGPVVVVDDRQFAIGRPFVSTGLGAGLAF